MEFHLGGDVVHRNPINKSYNANLFFTNTYLHHDPCQENLGHICEFDKGSANVAPALISMNSIVEITDIALSIHTAGRKTPGISCLNNLNDA